MSFSGGNVCKLRIKRLFGKKVWNHDFWSLGFYCDWGCCSFSHTSCLVLSNGTRFSLHRAKLKNVQHVALLYGSKYCWTSLIDHYFIDQRHRLLFYHRTGTDCSAVFYSLLGFLPAFVLWYIRRAYVGEYRWRCKNRNSVGRNGDRNINWILRADKKSFGFSEMVWVAWVFFTNKVWVHCHSLKWDDI